MSMQSPQGIHVCSGIRLLAAYLPAYVSGELSPPLQELVDAHLATCSACATVVKRFRSLHTEQQTSDDAHGQTEALTAAVSARRVPNLPNIRGLPHPQSIQTGQIWGTLRAVSGATSQHGARPPHLVVVVESPVKPCDPSLPCLLVAPISVATEYGAHDDLFVGAAESALGYRFMIETWNAVPMLTAQLGRYFGVLEAPVSQYLAQLSVATEHSKGSRLDLPADRTGLVLEHPGDPRWKFRHEEVSSCAYLRRPAVSLAREQVRSASGRSNSRLSQRCLTRLQEAPHVQPLQRLASRDQRGQSPSSLARPALFPHPGSQPDGGEGPLAAWKTMDAD